MSIRRFALSALFALAFAAATTVSAQEAEGVSPATAATTGKFVFTFTVTVSSTVPKNGVVVCTATASVSESSGQNIQQTAIGIATPSSGKATCVATMPYSWTLATPTSDKVYLSYKVELDYLYQVTASNGTAVGAEPAVSDKVGENLPAISVPLSGSTTSESVSSTI